MSVTVNGLQIDDNVKYLIEEIHAKHIADRVLDTQPIATRPGDKLIASEWDKKAIEIKGRIFGSSSSNLLANVDTLQQNFAVQSLALSIDSGRTYTATLQSLDIPTQFYNLSMVEYDAVFLCVDPFSYGNYLSVSGTTTSGTVTTSGTLTISGTVFAEPTLTINPIGARAGNSGINTLQIIYGLTGESITVSGTSFNYTSDLILDYKNFLVTSSGVSMDYSGIFSRFDVGNVNFNITVTSGVQQGFNWKWSYQPRYYQ